MELIKVCNCNPGVSHQPMTSTDAEKIRRVRKDSLATADRWERQGEDARQIICARYTAHLCLVRLRELKAMEVAA